MAKAKKKSAKLKNKPALKKKKVVQKKVLKKKAPKKKVAKRAKKVSAIPKGYNVITPYLIVNDGNRAIEFYKKVFGGKVAMQMGRPDGKIGHAELKFGDTKIMLADACPEMKAFAPEAGHGTAIGIYLYVKNVDDVVERAIAAGATLEMSVEDRFYGDRSGSVRDPFGHSWHVATHVEDVTPAQIRKRAAAMYGDK